MPMPSRPNGLRPRFAAGSAPRSANSGNWTPPRIAGSRTRQFAFPMLNMLDDCSRLFTGSKLYERELLLSYFDFLPAAFLAHGRPLQLYVDYHSIFFSQDPRRPHPIGLGA